MLSITKKHTDRELYCSVYTRTETAGRKDTYLLVQVMMQTHMKIFGGLLSASGAQKASSLGDCQVGLRNPDEARRWYDFALRGLFATHGEVDRSQLIALPKLATLVGLQHAHREVPWFARKRLNIYHETCRAEP